jgi:hypothetical protein
MFSKYLELTATYGIILAAGLAIGGARRVDMNGFELTVRQDPLAAAGLSTSR